MSSGEIKTKEQANIATLELLKEMNLALEVANGKGETGDGGSDKEDTVKSDEKKQEPAKKRPRKAVGKTKIDDHGDKDAKLEK
eukprot:2880932-Pyramimonas_sp.AAC.1